MNKAKNSEQSRKSGAAVPAYQNHVTLIGYLGRDPEQLESRAVLSLATKTSWKPKDSDQWQSRTEWHRVTAWGQLAEAVRPLAKGDHVEVHGDLRSSQYERQVQVTGGDIVTVTTKVFEIRAYAIQKLVPKEAKQPALAAA
jgi:single-strand DNA-binding protein